MNNVRIEMTWQPTNTRIPRRAADGSMTYFDLMLVTPEKYAGQIRDVTIHADRSVSLGPDKRRTAPKN